MPVRATLSSVMAGPAEGRVPAIHVFMALQLSKGVDGRDKPGHDAAMRGPT
jgi:hypothetical protein